MAAPSSNSSPALSRAKSARDLSFMTAFVVSAVGPAALYGMSHFLVDYDRNAFIQSTARQQIETPLQSQTDKILLDFERGSSVSYTVQTSGVLNRGQIEKQADAQIQHRQAVTAELNKRMSLVLVFIGGGVGLIGLNQNRKVRKLESQQDNSPKP